MLFIDKISLYQGATCLLENASALINAGWKVGLIGQNGSGKSSLLNAIQNKIQISAGQIQTSGNLVISTMEQEFKDTSLTILDAVLSANTEFVQLQKQIAEAEKKADLIALTTAMEKFDNIQGWQQEARACELLRGLGFSDADFAKQLKEFSGGWQMRVSLAMALFKPADLLLLDEPNNHLDIAANLWLEKWLLDYKGSLILISHDEYLLDSVATHILQIKNQNLMLHKGNYSGFIKKMQTQAEADMAMRKKIIAQRQHLQAFVDKFRYKATKAKQAQSRLKSLEKLPLIPENQVEINYSWEFFEPSPAGSPLLKFEQAELGYTNAKPILQDVNLIIDKTSRLGILGVNGAGKSTLVKSIAGDLNILAGKCIKSKKLKIAYFAQHQLDALDMQSTSFEHMQKLSEESEESLTAAQIRSFLGRFGFTGEKSLQRVESFSGGEKARLALALLVWQKPNLLLLDEPSNHLDLNAKQALILSLQNYTGALVIISHQRSLLNACVDEFLLVDKGKVENFKGDLEEYQKIVLSSQDSAKTPRQNSTDKLNPAQKRALLAPLRQEISQIEKQMNQTEQDFKQVNTELADPNLYKDDSQSEKIKQLNEKHGELEKRLGVLESSWLEKTENLDFILQRLDY